MRRLVLVRHGESNWNAEGRIQGQRCAGLSQRGHAQAKVTGAALAAIHDGARVVVSDLQRCQETAAPLVEALTTEPGIDARLRERSFGDWEGWLREDVRTRDPQRWERWRAGEDVVPEVGGESSEQLGERIEPVLRELLHTTPDGGVTIAVTHGGPVWHGAHRLLGLPFGTLAGVHNAAVTEFVSWDGQRALLDRWNEVGHLPPELRLDRRRNDGPTLGR